MKLIAAVKFAIKGIIFAFKSEQNMKIHFLAAILVTIVGFLLQISAGEWLVVILIIALVMSAELFNTALENIVNNITKCHPETYNDMGLPKDLAAGAVLLVSIAAFIVGLIIFLPYVTKLLF